MSMRELLKMFYQEYLAIYAGSMIGTFIFCSFFFPDAKFELNYFAWMMLFALLGDLPIFVFYSKKPLTRKQDMFRIGLHLCLLEIVLLTTAYFLGCYETIYQCFWFFLLILAIYMIIRLGHYGQNTKTAKKMNERLEEMRARSAGDIEEIPMLEEEITKEEISKEEIK